MSVTYRDFLANKSQLSGEFGFEPSIMPNALFPFQRHLVEWAVRKGRAAVFADCGLGKTLIQLTWAQNVVEKTGKPVLVLTPLAVSHQTVAEAHKFGIEAARSDDGEIAAPITVTNYERLHYFRPSDFAGAVCDESSILKNFDGATKAAVIEFMRTLPYRLLCTATAAPNDYIELGNSSEALGELGFMDMLSRFFKKADAAFCRKQETAAGTYRFRGHAERDFWRWVCSWARACRKPSDLGFPDDGFQLPHLDCRQYVVEAKTANPEYLFDMPARGLSEQRAERKRTLQERCELAAEIANKAIEPVVCWCHLNSESQLLAKLIPDAVEVSGSDSDAFKEESFRRFESGDVRVIVTKPTIAGFGLNWQHCAMQTFFPSHSFEQWYQAVRRSWRFGQERTVSVAVITSEGEQAVLNNLLRKEEAAEAMFASLVELMNRELAVKTVDNFQTLVTLPTWLT